ncbi:MAG TPA: magnesium and cobalt transport protein CorA [Sphingobacteriaceae bacterium]
MLEGNMILYKKDGRATEISLSDLPSIGPEEFVFADVLNPADDDFALLKDTFNFHSLAIEDAMSVSQVPKLDLYEDQLFVLLKTAGLRNDRVQFGEISFFLSKRFIIIVRREQIPGYREVRRKFENTPYARHRGPDFILHAVADFIVDNYLPVMQMIEDAVLGLEQQMLESFLNRAQITRIFQLRREVIHFQRVLGKMSEVFSKFVHLQVPCVSEEVKPFFSDVLDHLSRLDILASGLIDVITSVFEASSLLEQQQQGTITRKLAAWAGILAIPTAISSIYGMNFRQMPELNSPYGYFIALTAMAVLSLILYHRFKRSGWL